MFCSVRLFWLLDFFFLSLPVVGFHFIFLSVLISALPTLSTHHPSTVIPTVHCVYLHSFCNIIHFPIPILLAFLCAPIFFYFSVIETFVLFKWCKCNSSYLHFLPESSLSHRMVSNNIYSIYCHSMSIDYSFHFVMKIWYNVRCSVLDVVELNEK